MKKNFIKKEKLIVRRNKLVRAVLIFMAIVCMATSLSACAGEDNEPETAAQTAKFVPPEFDSSAEQGKPEVPVEDRYLYIYRDGMTFSAYLYGDVEIIDGKADIYFTNPATNTLWMKARIFDSEGKIIAETGLIKPDEYIKTVAFDTVPENGSNITVRIMTYEPDSYYSGGAVPVNIKNIRVSDG